MQLYEITLPLADNNGKPYSSAHAEYRAWLSAAFGGYTAYQVEGVWEGQAERNCVYRIASDNLDTLAQLRGQAAFRFTDQLAFFVACIGSAWVVDGPAAREGLI